MIYRGFRYKPNRYAEFKESSEFSLFVRTQNIPLLASNRKEHINVLGRDTPYDFEDGYNKKEIVLQCEIGDIFNYSERRTVARNIAEWLYEPGELILEYESDKVYQARLINQVDVEMLATYDVFELEFEVEAITKSNYDNDSITWETANIIWSGAKITWNMSDLETTFTGVTSGNELTINNLGTYEALPVIKLTGVASAATLTDDDGNSFTYTGLNGDIYIDCDNRLVYSISGLNKVNERANFTGDYIKLLAGENTIDVIGTITTLDIEFIFRNTYL